MTSSKAAIQAVVQSARRTFSRKFQNFVLNSEEFSASLNELKTLLDGLRACDVGLDKSHALKSTAPSATAPVTYIKIHEDQDVSIGIFVVKGGQKIPLHNHPKMHGLLKVNKFVKCFYVPFKKICQIRQVSHSHSTLKHLITEHARLVCFVFSDLDLKNQNLAISVNCHFCIPPFKFFSQFPF